MLLWYFSVHNVVEFIVPILCRLFPGQLRPYIWKVARAGCLPKLGHVLYAEVKAYRPSCCLLVDSVLDRLSYSAQVYADDVSVAHQRMVGNTVECWCHKENPSATRLVQFKRKRTTLGLSGITMF